MILYLKDPEDSTRKLLCMIKTFSKAAKQYKHTKIIHNSFFDIQITNMPRMKSKKHFLPFTKRLKLVKK
jgi:hypothetical protein